MRSTLVLLVLVLSATAKSYYYPDVTTEVRLLPSGDARVLQVRTYAFDGSFSWAYVDLKKQGAEDIVLNRLAEGTSAGWQDIEPQELSDSPKSLYVRWGYSATDEERMFLLDYTVVGAVRRYRDCAEFYWKVIEDEHEKMSRTRVLVLPPGASPRLFKVYVHSAAAPGRLSFASGFETAYVEQAGIPKNAFVEVRALTDPALYPGARLWDEPAYARILAEERGNFVGASLRKYLLIPLGLVLLLIVPTVLLAAFYRRHGREPKLDYDAVYEHEPPRRVPPAVVPIIEHQRPDEGGMTQPLFRSMMANLLDLARRGAVTVVEEKHGRKTKYRFRLTRPEVAAQGDEYDRMVAEFFFNKVGAGSGEFDEEALKKYGKKDPTAGLACTRNMLEGGKRWWRYVLGVEFVERVSSQAYNRFLLITGLSCALGVLAVMQGLTGIVATLRGRLLVAGVAGGLALLAFAVLGRGILRWTPAAYLEHLRWQKFKKFLTDFSAIEQAPVSLLGIWEQYYVYAVALGVAGEFLSHVTRLAERQGTGLALPVWYMAASGQGAGMASLGAGLAGFQSFATNMAGMLSSFSTASSSGGGFSGGGGGGGGGGSSGAG